MLCWIIRIVFKKYPVNRGQNNMEQLRKPSKVLITHDSTPNKYFMISPPPTAMPPRITYLSLYPSCTQCNIAFLCFVEGGGNWVGEVAGFTNITFSRPDSLRSKGFRASSSRKLRQEQKSPAPPRPTFFFFAPALTFA